MLALSIILGLLFIIFNVSTIIIIIIGLVVGTVYYAILDNKLKKKEQLKNSQKDGDE